MAGGRRPDYQVGIFNKVTQEKGNVGAAWKDDKGTGRISVKLNIGVTLVQSSDWFITLFPNEDKGDRPAASSYSGPSRTGTRDEMDDEIPF